MFKSIDVLNDLNSILNTYKDQLTHASSRKKLSCEVDKYIQKIDFSKENEEVIFQQLNCFIKKISEVREKQHKKEAANDLNQIAQSVECIASPITTLPVELLKMIVSPLPPEQVEINKIFQQIAYNAWLDNCKRLLKEKNLKLYSEICQLAEVYSVKQIYQELWRCQLERFQPVLDIHGLTNPTEEMMIFGMKKRPFDFPIRMPFIIRLIDYFRDISDASKFLEFYFLIDEEIKCQGLYVEEPLAIVPSKDKKSLRELSQSYKKIQDIVKLSSKELLDTLKQEKSVYAFFNLDRSIVVRALKDTKTKTFIIQKGKQKGSLTLFFVRPDTNIGKISIKYDYKKRSFVLPTIPRTEYKVLSQLTASLKSGVFNEELTENDIHYAVCDQEIRKRSDYRSGTLDKIEEEFKEAPKGTYVVMRSGTKARSYKIVFKGNEGVSQIRICYDTASRHYKIADNYFSNFGKALKALTDSLEKKYGIPFTPQP